MKITSLAQEFNDAAQSLQPSSKPPQEVPLSPPSDTPVKTLEKKNNPRSQRRSGRFGSELTLDD
jgi:hypothetical protein